MIIAGFGIEMFLGPRHHGLGNNSFAFIKGSDDNWFEIFSELEVILDGDIVDRPQIRRKLNTWECAFRKRMDKQ